ncbi:MAG: hypothetical protein IKF36_05660 [Bacilli bacterium]|nr:hypothetical protein [Bacilli bacterium]
MQLDISLNEPFTYSYLPLIISFILLVVFVVIFLCFNIKRKKKVSIIKEVIIPKNINDIKNKYLKELDELLNDKSLSKRKIYNKLSVIIRSFVLEATNIDVLKYSLAEIKTLKMDELTNLVEDYYEPEFSKESNADSIASIKNTREVIEKWK